MPLEYSKNKILENIEVSPGIFRLAVETISTVKPGQFYMLRGWETEPLLPRPISVHDTEDGCLKFLYETRGEGTRLLSKLVPGSSIELLGPLGNGFPLENISGRTAIITGGIGIAPMYKVAKELRSRSIDFYAGFRNDIYVTDKLSEFVDNNFISTESGKHGYKGYVTELFSPEKYDVVLCCGPEPMMKRVVDMCKKSSVPVYVSMEKHMACGVGACLACTCRTGEGNKRVCKDGPVFLGEDVIFDED